MRSARMLFGLALLGGLSSTASTLAAAGSDESALNVIQQGIAPAIDPTRLLTPADLVDRFAEDTGVSVEDARNAFADHVAIGDYVAEHWDSDDVGPIWVTYAGGYEVHTRVLSARNAILLESLEVEIEESINRHPIGPSMSELSRAMNLIATDHPDVKFLVDVGAGMIKVDQHITIPPDVIDSRYIQVSDTLAPPQPLASGGYHWFHWTGTTYGPGGCTVGYEMRVGSTGSRYIATAAHCADNWHASYSNCCLAGETTSSLNSYEACSTHDLQIQKFAGSVDRYVYDNPLGNWSLISRVADVNHWWQGTWTATYGRLTGFNWGTIQAYGTLPTAPPGGDCPSGFSIVGFWTTNSVQPGDSGGSLTSLWGSQFELLGTITSGSSGITYSADIYGNWIPSGAHICTQATPAGCG